MPDAGDGAGVKKDAARPRACPVLDTGVIRQGIDFRGNCYEGSGWPTISSQTSAWEKDAACPGRKTSVGEAARREAASLLGTADRRMSKVRRSRQTAMPRARGAGRGYRPVCKRQAHSDRLVEDEARGALRPRCPAGEAINSKRRTRVQREKRSTPAARPVPDV